MTENPQPAEPALQQQPLASNPPQPGIAANKYSAANDIMFEDCLKSIMLKSKTGKTYTSYKNKYCPRAKHSAFGDFPPEYMPKKQPSYDQASVSKESTMSATMKSKFLTAINNLL